MAVGTLRRVLQNVIRNGGIRAGDAIENGVERHSAPSRLQFSQDLTNPSALHTISCSTRTITWSSGVGSMKSPGIGFTPDDKFFPSRFHFQNWVWIVGRAYSKCCREEVNSSL